MGVWKSAVAATVEERVGPRMAPPIGDDESVCRVLVEIEGERTIHFGTETRNTQVCAVAEVLARDGGCAAVIARPDLGV